MYINTGFIENQDGSIVTLGGNHIYLQKEHSNGYNYIVFTASGSLTVLRSRNITECEAMIVGGGGSGGGNQGSSSGGGGGAGGRVAFASGLVLESNKTYTVTVGAGGSQSTISGNPGSLSSFSASGGSAGGAGGGAGYSTGPYSGDQYPGSGGVGQNGGNGGRGGYYAPGIPWSPSAGENGIFGSPAIRYEYWFPMQNGIVDSKFERVFGYYGTGGGGGEFQTRWDGQIGYAGGTDPWFVDPRYFLSYSGPYYGSGIGKLLTTPEGDSSYSNYFNYSQSSWPRFLGPIESRIFFGGNGGGGARGVYTANYSSNAGSDGIVIIKYRL